ncbi:MAG: STAS domain-containing protein [Pseudomonadota bacterium]
MSNNQFDEAEVSQREGVIFMTGVVTFETVAMLQKKIILLMQRDASLSLYQINLMDVKKVNSAALGLLVELKKYTIAHNKAVVFLNLPERLLSLAQVCGVAAWLELSCS